MTEETRKLINAAKATLQFYDTLDREHDEGEARVLDNLGRAVFDAERATTPTPREEQESAA